MKLNDTCKKCLLGKYPGEFPKNAPPEKAEEYRRRAISEITDDRGRSSPEIVAAIRGIREELFGPEPVMKERRSFFNRLMLSFEDRMRSETDASPDPLLTALRFSTAGNYIDFDAVGDVAESRLRALIDGAKDIDLCKRTVDLFRRDLESAKELTFFTDNCGETVADKALAVTLKKLFPGLHVTFIVRGGEAGGDADVFDAYEVGLQNVGTVVPSGNAVGGSVLRLMSDGARNAAESADVLISKGQANFETLSGCGLNVYYIFLCKCERFLNEFNVPRFTGIMVRENN